MQFVVLAMTVLLVGVPRASSAQLLCAAPPDGLVSWWQAEDNDADLTRRNITVANPNRRFANGKIGRAFYIDTNTYVEVLPSSNLRFCPNGTPCPGFTVEFWMKSNGVQRPLFMLAEKGHSCDASTGWHGWGIQGDANTGRLAFIVSDSPTTCRSVVNPASVLDGQWHHVAATWGNGSMHLYVDASGEEGPCSRFRDAMPNPNDVHQDPHLFIGTRENDSGRTFNGLVDEVSIYNRPASPEEIAAIRDASSTGKCTVCASCDDNDPCTDDCDVRRGCVHSWRQCFRLRKPCPTVLCAEFDPRCTLRCLLLWPRMIFPPCDGSRG